MKVVRVLSIDGGGIRGIIPATVLAHIEKTTGKRIAELFDLITGTSTGGVLALGLTKPGSDLLPEYKAEDLIAFYENEGKNIFKKGFFRSLFSSWGLLRPKYLGRDIEKVLNKYFGDAALKDCLTDVLITGYEIERRIPFFFKSRKAHIIPEYNFKMKDVARSTTAAPTFFSPSLIHSEKATDYFSLIDGGVYANNPALCGYAEAISNYPDADYYFVVSIGTGEQTKRIPYSKAKGWGVASWAVPILNTVFDGSSDTIDYQLKHIVRPMEKLPMYYRLQVILENVNNNLDDASAKNIRNLKLLAEDLIRREETTLQKLCESLVLFGVKGK